MIIERMNSHPEEFAGGFAKLNRFTSPGYGMSKRDQQAVQAAYGELILEPALAEDIITALVVKEEEPTEAMRLGPSGLGIGAAQSGLYARGYSDPRQQYGSPYQQALNQNQLQIQQQLAAQMTNAAMQTHPPLKLSPGVPGLSLDGEHLTGSMVKTIKQKLGIK
jgi:hypothetical protein